MRTDWFERGGEGTVGIEDVLEKMAAWDLPSDDLSALMSSSWPGTGRGARRGVRRSDRLGRGARVGLHAFGIVKLVVQAG